MYMKKRTLRMQVLRQLDSTLVTLKPLLAIPRPLTGWIAAIRKTLGMTHRQFAARMEVPESRISSIEKGEISGKTTLDTMERAAAALNCRFVYAIVPNESLEQFLKQQARRIATARVEYVNHHMMLEGQQVGSEALEQLIQEDIDESLNELSLKLWDKPT
jgi:predicted DNA-binding mobile mystery protein A